ncbi:MAG: isoprenylcysteine carboxylmethyltransferase family protein [Deltaproteobacteria bacterium]|nr:isoprenylcysteine carboxylmethyltransferase family protein [Deltaproteobacteria bacterium]
MKRKEQGIGRILPPPLFVIALFLLGFGIQWHYPLSFQNSYRSFWLIVGIILIAFSGLLAFLARRIMRSQKTPISFNKPTVAIIRNGPFAFTRNPLYLSLALLYSGAGIMVNSAWFAPLLIVLILFLHRVILREERYLERDFGNEYSIYKKNVRRWL